MLNNRSSGSRKPQGRPLGSPAGQGLVPYAPLIAEILKNREGKEDCRRCGNLVQDPSFESQSCVWQLYNATYANSAPYEGTAQLRLGPGVASASQVLNLHGAGKNPLLFSFSAYSNQPPSSEFNAGNLIAEVIWLDGDFDAIGTGLRMFIPADRLSNVARVVFFDQTDFPPPGAVFAKVVFSKGQGLSESEEDFIYVDNVVLAPTAHPNLIKNGGFEANLLHWTPSPGGDAAFLSSYKESLAGAGHAHTEASGSLIQDVDIRHLPPMTSFLFGFAARGIGLVSLNVRIEWQDNSGTPIGSGLNLSIPNETLAEQENYLSYLSVTFPTVPGTAIARIIFSASVTAPGDVLMLDQVLFVPVLTTNLITNPGFENGLQNWSQSLVNLIERADVYEGQFDAGLGEIGGALWQDVELCGAEGQCFLFSTALGFRQTSETATFGTMIMQVIWLDCDDREIGVGLTLIASRGPSNIASGFLEWVPYIGITEPVPPRTARARILFSKTDSAFGFIEVDNVTLAQLV